MTEHTHQQDHDHHSSGTTGATRGGLALRPAGYEVGDRVRVDSGAVPAAWAPPPGVRLTDRLQDLVGTVVEVHRCDSAEDTQPWLYEVHVPGLFTFPFTASELTPA